MELKVGFIGLGNAGGKLAGSLLRNDVELTVRDLDKTTAKNLLKEGAKWADSPKQMAENVDMVITCLPSPSACANVMEGEDGILNGLSKGKIWAEMSTTDSNEVKRLSKKVLALEAHPIDCPVSGGCHRAATGNISILAGCDRNTFEMAFPSLKTMGRRILHVGDVGTASILKVMTNYLATANLISVSEALTTAKAMGLDLNTTYEAIAISSGNSFVHETEGQVILNGSRDISFTMGLVLKDTGLFQKLAESHNVPLEISPKVVEIFQEGVKKYGPDELSPNIIKRLEESTGLSITAPGFPAEIIDDEPEESGYEVEIKK